MPDLKNSLKNNKTQGSYNKKAPCLLGFGTESLSFESKASNYIESLNNSPRHLSTGFR